MPDSQSDPEPTAREVKLSMKRDPTGKGCSGLRGDGVYRTFSGNRTASGQCKIVDARCFSPAQIKEHLDRGLHDSESEGKFCGVKTCLKRDSRIWTRDILPKVLSPEEHAELRELIHRQKREIEEAKKNGTWEKEVCDFCESNYDLAPRKDGGNAVDRTG